MRFEKTQNLCFLKFCVDSSPESSFALHSIHLNGDELKPDWFSTTQQH